MAAMASAPQEVKAALRHEMARRRREAAEAYGSGPAALALKQALLDHLPKLGNLRAVSGYVPIGDEIDPRPALSALSATGIGCCLPVVVGKDRPLIFREYADGAPLQAGPFKTKHPLPSAPEVVPDVILVPLLAFDRNLNRLGWGGGFYDRTLAQLKQSTDHPIAIGIAYSAQQVDTLPTEVFDHPLDRVITEAGWFELNRSERRHL